MKAVITFLVLLITISNSYSKTDKIEGIIRDGINNKPLPNVLVTLYRNDDIFDTKYTSNSGNFEFFRLDSSNYNLKFELNSYKTIERNVIITSPNNITHSFNLFFESSNPIVASVKIKEYPYKSDYEYFLVNHLYKKYDTDTTMIFTSTGDCEWNSNHQMLYVGVLHLKSKVNGEVEILEKSKLLGAYEVIPDKQEIVAKTEEPKSKKFISLLEKVAESASKVITENPGVVFK